MRPCLYSFTNPECQEEAIIELITYGMLGKFTSFPYSCINGVCRWPCGNNSTNCTAPFSPTASCSAGMRTVCCGSGNCDLSTSLKHIAQKKRSLASYGNCEYLCRCQRKGYGCILEVNETLFFFILKYIYGLKLPVVAGAFPELITVHPRRRTRTTLVGFLPYCYFPTMSSSLYFPQRCAEIGPLPDAQHTGCRISL